MMVNEPPSETVAQIVPPPLTRKDKFNIELYAVCAEHELSPGLLLEGPRAAFIVKARRALAYALRQKHGWSLTILARLLHKKDHTSVRHLIVQHCIHHGLALPPGITTGTRPRTNTMRGARIAKRKRRLAKSTRKAIAKTRRRLRRKSQK